MTNKYYILLVLLANILALATTTSIVLAQVDSPPISKLTFSNDDTLVNVLTRIPRARQMALTSDNSILFVGTSSNDVYFVKLVKDAKTGQMIQDPKSSTPTIMYTGNVPNGVAVDDSTGHVYIGCNDGLYRIPLAVTSIKNGSSFAAPVLVKALTPQTTQNRRYLKIHNNRLYMSLGAPCDHCTVSDPIGTIVSLKHQYDDASLQDFKVEARGIRNTVGFDFHPTTGELWFTDNGRDVIQEDRPYDELNRVPKNPTNIHFGFPYCYEKDMVDAEFNTKGSCKDYVPAEYVLGPHVAALGMAFYKGEMFPEPFNKNHRILIAERGSINQDPATGYRITMVDPTDPSDKSYQVFASGFIEPKSAAWGRPVDVLVMADGSVLISDDTAGAVYRIHYKHSGNSAATRSASFALLIAVAALAQFAISLFL